MYKLTCKTWQFAKSFHRLWGENQISIRAAALTYTFILSLVPALALCFAMFSFFSDFSSLQGQLKEFLLTNLSTGSGENVTHFLEHGLKSLRLKTIGYWGLGGLIISGFMLLSAIQDSMNKIWRVEKKQRLWIRFLLYQAFFILGPIGISIATATAAYISKHSPKFFYPAQIASVLLCTLIFAVLYILMPATTVRWKNAAISALLAALAVEFAKRGFAIYTTKFLVYNKVYGGLAALPFLLVWIYLNWMIFLSGTQLNCMLDRHIGPTNEKE